MNDYRIEGGRRRVRSRICDQLPEGPDVVCIPVGNAGQHHRLLEWASTRSAPRRGCIGFQAEGAAPLVIGEPVAEPETVASAIRIGNPRGWEDGDERRHRPSRGEIRAVSDDEILDVLCPARRD